MDHRDLLKKYMAIVVMYEGISFLGRDFERGKLVGMTEEQWNYAKEIEKEVYIQDD